MTTPIERAITQLGGLNAFALAIGVKPPTASEWRKNIRPNTSAIPPVSATRACAAKSCRCRLPSGT